MAGKETGTLGRHMIRPHTDHRGGPGSIHRVLWCWDTKQEVLGGGVTWHSTRAHLHALLLVLHAVQLVILIAVLVLAVLQEGDLLEHGAAQAFFAVFACRIPAHNRGAEGALVLPGDKAQMGGCQGLVAEAWTRLSGGLSAP